MHPSSNLDDYKCKEKPVDGLTIPVCLIIAYHEEAQAGLTPLESILEYTPAENVHIRMVDSTDDALVSTQFAALLDDDSTGMRGRCQIIRPTARHNLARCLNDAIEAMNRDLVICRGDVTVWQDWLIRLQQTAYSHPKIATVTPLFNNGPYCAVPQDRLNAVNHTWDLRDEETARVIAAYSAETCTQVPTGCGLCLYVRRSAIERCGGFDDTLPEGSPWDVDFCFRAREAGFVNLVDDSVYVCCTEKTTWPDTAPDGRPTSDAEVIRHRLPSYSPAISEPINSSLKAIQEHNYKLLSLKRPEKAKRSPDRLNVLALLHNAGGGSAVFAHQLAGELNRASAGEVNTVVCYGCRKDDGGRPGERFLIVQELPPKAPEGFKFPLPGTHQCLGPLDHYSVASNRIYAKILDEQAIGALHVHHFMNHTLDVMYEASRRNIPIILTVHDYYMICPIPYLYALDDDECCDFERCLRDSSCCGKAVFGESFGFGGSVKNFIETWRSQFREVLNMACCIVFPDESVRELFARAYPDLPEQNGMIIEHGALQDYHPAQDENAGTSRNDTEKKKFRAAFVGHMVEHKGAPDFAALVTLNKDRGIQWHHYGGGRVPLVWKFRRDVVLHGAYERRDIVRSLVRDRIDLIVLLSRTPETYSFVLSEAAAAGIPVLATAVGALGTRVAKYRLGWTIPLGERPADLLKHIHRLKANPILLVAKRESSLPVPRFADIARQYRELYASALKDRQRNGEACTFDRLSVEDIRKISVTRLREPERSQPGCEATREELLKQLVFSGRQIARFYRRRSDLVYFGRSIAAEMVAMVKARWGWAFRTTAKKR